jgi:hypothetical protein
MLLLGGCERTSQSTTAVSLTLDDAIVDASCGQCNLGLSGSGCELAIRTPDGESLFVHGFSIDEFGDAHAEDGFCACVRKARVTGATEEAKGGTYFHATEFELLPIEPESGGG